MVGSCYNCGAFATVQMVWPGQAPAFVCEVHLDAARTIANAMGFVLGIIDLTRECATCSETQVFMGDGKWSCKNGHYGIRSKEEFVLDKLWGEQKCKNCRHSISRHGRLGCTDISVDGALRPVCGCTDFEPSQEWL